jgi:hypothetical protein
MGTEIVGSHEPTLASDALHPSDRGFGQNGFSHASSDLPGEKSVSGFLPAAVLPKGNPQTRHVSDAGFPAAHGMKGAAPGPKVPDNGRPVKR